MPEEAEYIQWFIDEGLLTRIGGVLALTSEGRQEALLALEEEGETIPYDTDIDQWLIQRLLGDGDEKTSG